jgi:hypothetical protein
MVDRSTFLRWVDELPVVVQGACKIKRLELQIPSLFTFEDIRSTFFVGKYESRKKKHQHILLDVIARIQHRPMPSNDGTTQTRLLI